LGRAELGENRDISAVAQQCETEHGSDMAATDHGNSQASEWRLPLKIIETRQSRPSRMP
jgi:hypothetical protein